MTHLVGSVEESAITSRMGKKKCVYVGLFFCIHPNADCIVYVLQPQYMIVSGRFSQIPTLKI